MQVPGPRQWASEDPRTAELTPSPHGILHGSSSREHRRCLSPAGLPSAACLPCWGSETPSATNMLTCLVPVSFCPTWKNPGSSTEEPSHPPADRVKSIQTPRRLSALKGAVLTSNQLRPHCTGGWPLLLQETLKLLEGSAPARHRLWSLAFLCRAPSRDDLSSLRRTLQVISHTLSSFFYVTLSAGGFCQHLHLCLSHLESKRRPLQTTFSSSPFLPSLSTLAGSPWHLPNLFPGLHGPTSLCPADTSWSLSLLTLLPGTHLSGFLFFPLTWNTSRICMSSSLRGHANLCVIQI